MPQTEIKTQYGQSSLSNTDNEFTIYEGDSGLKFYNYIADTVVRTKDVSASIVSATQTALQSGTRTTTENATTGMLTTSDSWGPISYGGATYNKGSIEGKVTSSSRTVTKEYAVYFPEIPNGADSYILSFTYESESIDKMTANGIQVTLNNGIGTVTLNSNQYSVNTGIILKTETTKYLNVQNESFSWNSPVISSSPVWEDAVETTGGISMGTPIQTGTMLDEEGNTIITYKSDISRTWRRTTTEITGYYTGTQTYDYKGDDYSASITCNNILLTAEYTIQNGLTIVEEHNNISSIMYPGSPLTFHISTIGEATLKNEVSFSYKTYIMNDNNEKQYTLLSKTGTIGKAGPFSPANDLLNNIPKTYQFASDNTTYYFKQDDVWGIEVTLTSILSDDQEYTITKDFSYLLNYQSAQLTNITTSIMNGQTITSGELMEFKLIGTIGTYDIKTVDWTLKVIQESGEQLNYNVVGSATLSNNSSPFSIFTCTMPSSLLQNYAGTYKLQASAVATLVDGEQVAFGNETAAGLEINSLTVLLNTPILNLFSTLFDENKKIHPSDNITTSFLITKPSSVTDEYIGNPVKYELQIISTKQDNSATRTQLVETETGNTLLWLVMPSTNPEVSPVIPLSGPMNYTLTGTATYASGATVTATKNYSCISYIKPIEALSVQYTGGSHSVPNCYYNDETAELYCTVATSISDVITSIDVRNELTGESMLEAPDIITNKLSFKTYDFSLPLNQEPYINHRGLVTLRFIADASNLNSEYIDTEFLEQECQIAILSPNAMIDFPNNNTNNYHCFATPRFGISTSHGTYSTGKVLVALSPSGPWIKTDIDLIKEEGTARFYSLVCPFMCQENMNNSSYDIYIKETNKSAVILNGKTIQISPRMHRSWMVQQIPIKQLKEYNYRLIEKYNYRRMLAMALQWRNGIFSKNVTTDKSQLEELVNQAKDLKTLYKGSEINVGANYDSYEANNIFATELKDLI